MHRVFKKAQREESGEMEMWSLIRRYTKQFSNENIGDYKCLGRFDFCQ